MSTFTLKMLQKNSKAVPEGNGPIAMLGGITLEELRRVMSETFCRDYESFERDQSACSKP